MLPTIVVQSTSLETKNVFHLRLLLLHLVTEHLNLFEIHPFLQLQSVYMAWSHDYDDAHETVLGTDVRI